MNREIKCEKHPEIDSPSFCVKCAKFICEICEKEHKELGHLCDATQNMQNKIIDEIFKNASCSFIMGLTNRMREKIKTTRQLIKKFDKEILGTIENLIENCDLLYSEKISNIVRLKKDNQKMIWLAKIYDDIIKETIDAQQTKIAKAKEFIKNFWIKISHAQANFRYDLLRTLEMPIDYGKLII